MGSYQGYGYGAAAGYGGYPYGYPPYQGGAAAYPPSSRKKGSAPASGKKAKLAATAMKHHRPPLPPMAYNGWSSSPEYKILVEYYHMVGTTKLLFQPTLEAICKLSSGGKITKDHILDWMKIERSDYYTMAPEQRSRTATFDLLAKIDFPFGTPDNYHLDTTSIMVASKVQRRKVPFLGILSKSPTLAELQEGVAAQRQGPVWDCMYLALSDYVKISGTLQIIEPAYMTVILRQFAKDNDEDVLTLDHLLTWMATQRASYRDTTIMTNQREMTKATSKLSCLQTVGFDWDYEPRVIDATIAYAKANAPAASTEKDVEKAVKKGIEDFIFDDGDNFLVRTDKGNYYKSMKAIPNDPNASGNMPPTRSSHLPANVEKAILRTMLPPQNSLQFSHIANLNLDLFGYPEDKLRKACTNRRKYLEKVENNNPATFKRLLKQAGLPDGKEYEVGGEIPNKEIEILIKSHANRKKEDPAKVEEAILRSMMPPQDKIPFGEICARREKLFGPPNGKVVRAAKKRRKELDELKRVRPDLFKEVLQKAKLDKVKEADNAFVEDEIEEAVSEDDDDGNLFWNKPGANVLADKETQKKYRMQRNPLPLETDKLLCKHVLGGDFRFALLCNSRPSLFGLPNSRERRKIDDRRRLLREMMQKRPSQFVEVCKAHSLDGDLKKTGFLKADGTINEEMSAKLAAGKGGADDDDMNEDKSPTKVAAMSLHALRQKGGQK
ncbi:MAG: hypothetical protein SGILL_009180 [Bacillariaceae sp.]